MLLDVRYRIIASTRCWLLHTYTHSPRKCMDHQSRFLTWGPFPPPSAWWAHEVPETATHTHSQLGSARQLMMLHPTSPIVDLWSSPFVRTSTGHSWIATDTWALEHFENGHCLSLSFSSLRISSVHLIGYRRSVSSSCLKSVEFVCGSSLTFVSVENIQCRHHLPLQVFSVGHSIYELIFQKWLDYYPEFLINLSLVSLHSASLRQFADGAIVVSQFLTRKSGPIQCADDDWSWSSVQLIPVLAISPSVYNICTL